MSNTFFYSIYSPLLILVNTNIHVSSMLKLLVMVRGVTFPKHAQSACFPKWPISRHWSSQPIRDWR